MTGTHRLREWLRSIDPSGALDFYSHALRSYSSPQEVISSYTVPSRRGPSFDQQFFEDFRVSDPRHQRIFQRWFDTEHLRCNARDASVESTQRADQRTWDDHRWCGYGSAKFDDEESEDSQCSSRSAPRQWWGAVARSWREPWHSGTQNPGWFDWSQYPDGWSQSNQGNWWRASDARHRDPDTVVQRAGRRCWKDDALEPPSDASSSDCNRQNSRTRAFRESAQRQSSVPVSSTTRRARGHCTGPSTCTTEASLSRAPNVALECSVDDGTASMPHQEKLRGAVGALGGWLLSLDGTGALVRYRLPLADFFETPEQVFQAYTSFGTDAPHFDRAFFEEVEVQVSHQRIFETWFRAELEKRGHSTSSGMPMGSQCEGAGSTSVTVEQGPAVHRGGGR